MVVRNCLVQTKIVRSFPSMSAYTKFLGLARPSGFAEAVFDPHRVLAPGEEGEAFEERRETERNSTRMAESF